MPSPGHIEAQAAIEGLLEGRHDVLDRIYDDYSKDFLRWAGRRFSANREDLENAWQDTVIAFYEQVTLRKKTSLNCQLRTWLFAIGYRKLLKNHRKMKRLLWKDEIDEALLRNEALALFQQADDPWESERELLLAAMNLLSAQCQLILRSKYYEDKKLEEIMSAHGYASLNATSASLSRCLNKLKEIILK